MSVAPDTTDDELTIDFQDDLAERREDDEDLPEYVAAW